MEIDESVVGKKAYKKHGFYSGLVGVVEKSDFISPYKICMIDGYGNKNGSSVGTQLRDLVFLEE